MASRIVAIFSKLSGISDEWKVALLQHQDQWMRLRHSVRRYVSNGKSQLGNTHLVMVLEVELEISIRHLEHYIGRCSGISAEKHRFFPLLVVAHLG